ncbi:MAG: arsenate reductase [Actinobacteria bacterium]|nr:MAG: arsenate reductase [Actinomycetota bacterium]
MSDVIVYEKRTCTTCRQVADLLRSRGIEYDDVQYHVEGISEARIREVLALAGISARDTLRMREDGAAELAEAPEDEIVAAMAARPELLQRPIVVRGDRAVLARPPEKVLELFE